MADVLVGTWSVAVTNEDWAYLPMQGKLERCDEAIRDLLAQRASHGVAVNGGLSAIFLAVTQAGLPEEPPRSECRSTFATLDPAMKTIPQRTLRNESGEVLRRAEAGERFVVTVHGRPVAVLGPYERRQWVPTPAVRDLLRTPTDPTLLEDLGEMDAGADLADPWLE